MRQLRERYAFTTSPIVIVRGKRLEPLARA